METNVTNVVEETVEQTEEILTEEIVKTKVEEINKQIHELRNKLTYEEYLIDTRDVNPKVYLGKLINYLDYECEAKEDLKYYLKVVPEELKKKSKIMGENDQFKLSVAMIELLYQLTYYSPIKGGVNADKHITLITPINNAYVAARNDMQEIDNLNQEVNDLNRKFNDQELARQEEVLKEKAEKKELTYDIPKTMKTIETFIGEVVKTMQNMEAQLNREQHKTKKDSKKQ